MNEGQGSQNSLRLGLPLRRNQYLPTRLPPLHTEMGVFLVAFLDMGGGEQGEGTRRREPMTRCSGKVFGVLWEGALLSASSRNTCPRSSTFPQILELTASGSPGSSLEMQNLRPHPRSPEPESAFLTRSPAICRRVEALP